MFGEGNEIDPQRLKCLQSSEQVGNGAGESVELPDADNVAASASEMWTTFFALLSILTVTSALRTLTMLKIAKESTGKRRDRMFVYPRYLHPREGTEPLKS